MLSAEFFFTQHPERYEECMSIFRLLYYLYKLLMKEKQKYAVTYNGQTNK